MKFKSLALVAIVLTLATSSLTTPILAQQTTTPTPKSEQTEPTPAGQFVTSEIILAPSSPVIARTLDGDGGGGSDICTKAPDKVRGIFDFTAACIGHDICYAKVRNRNLGRQGLIRCDIRFRSEMLRHCNSKRSGRRLRACKITAEAYYRGVRIYSRTAKI